MAGRFSTAKRSKEATSEAVSKIGDAFASGAEAAEKQSRWKSFINSKAVQGICAGSKTFGKFVAAKTATAAKWAGTKAKDAGHDLWQGTKAFGHSFADSYRTRQEEKRTAKFIKGCEERGFVVMAQDEFQSAYKSMSDMHKALYPERPSNPDGPTDVDAVFTYFYTDNAISQMRDRIMHFNATNGINEPATAIQNTVEYPAAAKTLADAYPETQEFLASKFDPAKAKELADKMSAENTAAKTEPKSKSNASVLTDDELKSAKTVFEYDYEHNDGDQIWDDTRSYKVDTKTGSFVRVSTDGWTGNTTVAKVTVDEFNKDMARVNEEIARQDSLRAQGHYVRGGYSITSKFTDEDKALVDEVTSPAAEMKDNIRDAAENGVKSDKLSTKLSQACASLDERLAQIRESLDRINQAQTEEEKSQIASDCIRELRNHIVGMGNKLNEDVHDIEASKSDASKTDRGNEFDFAETDDTKDAAADYDGV